MFSEQVGKCIIMTVNKEKSGASKCEASPSPWIPPIHTHTRTPFFPQCMLFAKLNSGRALSALPCCFVRRALCVDTTCRSQRGWNSNDFSPELPHSWHSSHRRTVGPNSGGGAGGGVERRGQNLCKRHLLGFWCFRILLTVVSPA